MRRTSKSTAAAAGRDERMSKGFPGGQPSRRVVAEETLKKVNEVSGRMVNVIHHEILESG